MDLISIVVPCYNEQEALPEFYKEINKVLQDMNNVSFEMIFIDDGSKDASFSICLGYEKRFENVFAFHQKNAGPGSARNFGLKHINGKYINLNINESF